MLKARDFFLKSFLTGPGFWTCDYSGLHMGLGQGSAMSPPSPALAAQRGQRGRPGRGAHLRNGCSKRTRHCSAPCCPLGVSPQAPWCPPLRAAGKRWSRAPGCRVHLPHQAADSCVIAQSSVNCARRVRLPGAHHSKAGLEPWAVPPSPLPPLPSAPGRSPDFLTATVQGSRTVF